MMRLSGVLLAAAAVAVAAGCDDTTGVAVADLVGTWNATKVEYVSTADPTTKFDLVANGGSLTLTLIQDGTFTGSLGFPGLPPESLSGTLTVQGTNLVITNTGEPADTVSFTLEGNTLTFTDSDEDFDFDFDGVDEDATLTVVFVRQ